MVASYSLLETAIICSVVFLLCALFSWLHCKTKKNIFGLVAVLLPSILSCTRGSYVGSDFIRYLEAARKIQSGTFQDVTHELGYKFIVWIGTTISENLTVVFFVVYFALFSVAYIGCCKIAKSRELIRFSKDPTVLSVSWVGYIAFVCSNLLNSWNPTRQTFAQAIILWGIYFILELKPWKWSGFVFIAMLFHKSAIFCLPWYYPFARSGRVLQIFYTLSYLLMVVVGVGIVAPWFGYAGYGSSLAFQYSAVDGGILLLGFLPLLLTVPSSIFKGFSIELIVVSVFCALAGARLNGLSRVFYYPEMVVVLLAMFFATDKSSLRKWLGLGICVIYFYVYCFLWRGGFFWGTATPIYFEFEK